MRCTGSSRSGMQTCLNLSDKSSLKESRIARLRADPALFETTTDMRTCLREQTESPNV